MTPRQAQQMLQAAPISKKERTMMYKQYLQDLNSLKVTCYKNTRNNFKNRAQKVLMQKHELSGGDNRVHAQRMSKVMQLFDTGKVLEHMQQADVLHGGTHKHGPNHKGNKMASDSQEDLAIADVLRQTLEGAVATNDAAGLLGTEISKMVRMYVTGMMSEVDTTTAAAEAASAAQPSNGAQVGSSAGWYAKMKEWGGAISMGALKGAQAALKTSVSLAIKGSMWMFDFMLRNPTQAAFCLLLAKNMLREWCKHFMIFVGRTRMVQGSPEERGSTWGNVRDVATVSVTQALSSWMDTSFGDMWDAGQSATMGLVTGALSMTPVGMGAVAVINAVGSIGKMAVKTGVEFELYNKKMSDNWKQIVEIFKIITSECFSVVEMQEPFTDPFGERS
jgi:hypothetical protein